MTSGPHLLLTPQDWDEPPPRRLRRALLLPALVALAAACALLYAAVAFWTDAQADARSIRLNAAEWRCAETDSGLLNRPRLPDDCILYVREGRAT